MMKRGKKLHIAIDKLPTGLVENGKIMNGSSSGCGVNSRNITSLIGIGIAFRRRKNFSLILFVGLSALLCALYYTTYYPGAVWTLRLAGVSSAAGRSGSGAGTPTNAPDQIVDSLVLAGSTELNLNNHGARKTKGEKIPPSGADGPRKSSKDVGDQSSSNSQVISSSSSMRANNPNGGAASGDQVAGKSGSYPPNNNGNEDGESGASPTDEISTPKTWNWKYWASLEYWKVNLTVSAGEDDDHDDDVQVDEFPRSLSTKPADGEFPSVADPATAGGVARRKEAASAALTQTTGQVGEATRGGNRGREEEEEERLSCNFPRLNPFDPSITEFIKSPPAIDCRKSYPLVFRTNFRNKLIQWGQPFPLSAAGAEEGQRQRKEQETREGGVGASDKVGNYNCCYKTITRGNGSDHNVIFSKRCYPILKKEMVIPATHEFISVRCRKLAAGRSSRGGNQQQPPNNNKGPSTHHTNNNNGAGGGSAPSAAATSNNNGEDNGNMVAAISATIITTANNNNNNNTTTKVYKDMLAFVPLKPLVEDRIRKYEESKRKLLYTQKKRNSEKRENNPVRANGHQQAVAALKQQSANFSPKSGLNHESQPSGKEPQSEILTSNEDRLSVLVLGLDAQSHMNFIRQMPQTYNFLVKNLSAVGMYGYTKVGDNTFPNVVTLLSGLSVDELILRCWPTKDSYFDSCPFIWKKFAESGYRTSLAEDSVWMGTFNYEKKGFLQPPTDYYLHPLSLLMAKKIGHETWANAKLCYGPRFAFEVLLDYIVKTAVTFRDSLYFQFVWSNSLFHDYLNNPRLGDELLYMTLEYLRNNGYLNNTALLLMSDHGIRWGSIRSTYQGKIEERMPLVYLAFPQWFRRKYPKAFRNLRRNVLRLTTPFDVYETLKDVLRISTGKKVRFDRWSNDGHDDDDDDDDERGGGRNDNKGKGENIKSSGGGGGGGPPDGSGNNADAQGSDSESDEKPPRGISLFRPIPLSRTCKQAGIEEHWCVCHSMQSVPINSTLVQSGAQFIVQVINGLVRKHSGFCAKLVLFKINEAKRKIDGDIDRGLDIDFQSPTTISGGGSGGESNGVGKRSSRDDAAVEVVVPTGTRSLNNGGGGHTSGLGSSTDTSGGILGGSRDNKRDITEKREKLSRQQQQREKNGHEHSAEKTDKVLRRRKKRKSAAVTSSTTTIKRVKRDEDDVLTSLSTSSDIKKMIQLQLVIVTTPGNAVFEATIFGVAEIVNRSVNDQDIDQEAGERSNHHWKLSGDISRLNLYGTQSACVNDYAVQKYCYCHNLDTD